MFLPPNVLIYVMIMFNLTFIYLLYQSILSSEIFLIFLSVSFFFWGWFPANVYDYHAGL